MRFAQCSNHNGSRRSGLGTALALVMLFSLVLGCGCRSYQAGFLAHPQIDSIAVGPFENRTQEATFGPRLRAAMAEAIMRDGSLALEDYDAAETVVHGQIVAMNSRRIASSSGGKISLLEEDGGQELEDHLSDYQKEQRGTLYRLSVEVTFQVIVPRQNGRIIIGPQTVTGEGSYPGTPDMDVGRSEAIKQASNDAARQIVAAITEAW